VSMSFAEGIGVGSGSGSDRDRRITELRQELDRARKRAKIPANGLRFHCGGVRQILNVAVRKSRELIDKGKLSLAEQTIREALEAVDLDFSEWMSLIGGTTFRSIPISQRLVKRALLIHDSMNIADNSGSPAVENVDRLSFLLRISDEISRAVIDLDQQIWLSFIDCVNGCASGAPSQSSSPSTVDPAVRLVLIQAAKRQLQILYSDYLRPVPGDSEKFELPKGKIYPEKYSFEATVRIAAVLFAGVAEDLIESQSLKLLTQDCGLVGDLETESKVITDFFELGDRSVFKNNVEAGVSAIRKSSELDARVRTNRGPNLECALIHQTLYRSHTVKEEMRIELRFFNVLYRYQANAMALIIDYQKFFNTMLM